MSIEQTSSVLILGGSGQAGSDTAALLRRWYPDLPLTIAGRTPERLRKVADELGVATVATIDLSRPDLGLPDHGAYSAVVATLWDNQLNGLRIAQDRGLPYLSISSGLVDIGPEVIAAAQRPTTSAITIASHWCAGTATLATLLAARDFTQTGDARVDAVRVGAILDANDLGGPAGAVDLERFATATTAGLVRRDGVFAWVNGTEADVAVQRADGSTVTGQAIAIPDVPSVALATGAKDVTFAFAVVPNSTPPQEVRIDLEGTDSSGARAHQSYILTHPHGQRPLTALGLALTTERLIGLQGPPVAPGLHTPESLIDLTHTATHLTATGATFTRLA
ncbi:saccharopine dehydrogenase [Kribbella hippodromi]|uniref:saccharopine dehydrogenase n=1 Tax=Kribbella hippodromi TaxID=434347 RepID=UPI0031D549C1